MDLFPTKGNLMTAKSTLRMSRQGFELLDKKRNILVREMMELIDRAEGIQTEIDATFRGAYIALQTANMTLGISAVRQISRAIPEEDEVNIRFRSVMGVEIPIVGGGARVRRPEYSLYETNSALDEAGKQFQSVKELTLQLVEVENSVYRLAEAVRRAQKRANALKNITIPRFERIVADISNALEEKDREEFTRLKAIKAMLSQKE